MRAFVKMLELILNPIMKVWMILKIDLEGEQTAEHVWKIVWEKLGVEGDLSLQRANRDGSDNSDWPKTIIASFLNFQDRQKILRNRYLLEGSNIYVNEDLCVASIAKCRQQLPELQRSKNEGKIAVFCTYQADY